MINLMTCVCLAAGLAAGVLHATMLWRASSRHTAWTPLLGMLRLSAVATVLVLAAFAGAILAAATGWAIGFIALGAGFVIGRNGRSTTAPTIHSEK